MTQEQFEKARALSQKLSDLSELAKDQKRENVCLSYVAKYEYYTNSHLRYYPINKLDVIQDILDRHDRMIREEIDEEIEKLKKGIETL